MSNFSCSTTSATKGTSAHSTSRRTMVSLRNWSCMQYVPNHSRISAHSRDCLLFDQVCNRSTTQDQDFKRNTGLPTGNLSHFWSSKNSPTWSGARILEQGKTMIDVIITMFIVFSLEIGVPRIPQETRSRYQKNYTLLLYCWQIETCIPIKYAIKLVHTH